MSQYVSLSIVEGHTVTCRSYWMFFFYFGESCLSYHTAYVLFSGHNLCPVASFKKYIQKLHPARSDLWQRPVESFEDNDDTWYMNQPVGKNTLCQIMKTLSKQANLSREYTNHSIRATSITVLDYKKFSNRDIMAISGHKSETSLKSYTGKVTSSRKYEMSSALYQSVVNEDVIQGEIMLTQEQVDELMAPMEQEDTNVKLDDICNNNTTSVNIVDISDVMNNNSKTLASVQNVQNIMDIPMPQAANAPGMPAFPFQPVISNCVVNFNINMNQ